MVALVFFLDKTLVLEAESLEKSSICERREVGEEMGMGEEVTYTIYSGYGYQLLDNHPGVTFPRIVARFLGVKTPCFARVLRAAENW